MLSGLWSEVTYSNSYPLLKEIKARQSPTFINNKELFKTNNVQTQAPEEISFFFRESWIYYSSNFL